MIGLISLSLAACAGRSNGIEYADRPADVPEASLVAPCDTTEGDPATNGDLANELNRTRRQRDDCAGRMDGVRQWRSDAIKRAAPNVGTLPKS